MRECYGTDFILNGELQPSELFESSLIYEGESVYEVIRLVRGCPVFFHDHLERLEASVQNKKNEMLADRTSIFKSIIKLSRAVKKKDINVKIVFNYKNSNNWLVYFIESLYPTSSQYSNGVKGILFDAERKSPESKVINHKLRSEIAHRLINEGGYEALLVNADNLITEGSRSNIFFIRNKILYTAPDKLILKGVTRKHILDICRDNNLSVKFECVNTKDIVGYEAAFMTGTSPMVLPFCCISITKFNVKHPLLEELRRLYILKVEESLRLFRPD